MRMPQTTTLAAAGLAERAGDGYRLPAAVRERLESSLGANLSAVRIHTGPEADTMARALRADAFTCGSEVFFRDGAYRPGTRAGLRLLVHEIAHVLQQARGQVGAGGHSGPARLPAGGAPGGGAPDGGAAGDRWERRADRSAEMVLAGGAVPGSSGARTIVTAGLSGVIQCHGSYEHRILGDVHTSELVAVSKGGPEGKAVLDQQIALLDLWQKNPADVHPSDVWRVDEKIRLFEMGPDKLVVTYGELNALPDYLPGALSVEGSRDALGREFLLPILQTLRQEGYNRLRAVRDKADPYVKFDDSVYAPRRWAPGFFNTIKGMYDMDLHTFGLGPDGVDHYGALLARNACHFVPFSWYRWMDNHIIARNFATQFYKSGDQSLGRMAMVYNGYADHFLQDSFAAGHLIDKSLVMQWFIEWAGRISLWPKPVADWQIIKDMATGLQPFAAGGWLYARQYAGPSNDPQYAQTAGTLVERFLESTVAADMDAGQFAAYQKYLTFLTSTAAQLAIGQVHDEFNRVSLWVSSETRRTPYRVWGDYTLLSGEGGADGVQATSEATWLAQKSIQDILQNGTTPIGIDQIRQRFPTMAGEKPDSVRDLKTWAENIQPACAKLWDGLAASIRNTVVEMGASQMGVVSVDQRFAQVWHGKLEGTTASPVSVLARDGRLYAGADGTVFELDPHTGRTLHSLPLAPAPPGSSGVSLASDGQRVYAGIAGRVYGIDPDDWSRQAWTSDPVCPGFTGPVGVLVAGGRLFAGSGGCLHELSGATGKSRRSKSVSPAPATPSAMRLAADGERLYAGMSGKAFAVRLSDFNEAWKPVSVGSTVKDVDVMICSDYLFAGCDRYVHRLNFATGQAVGSAWLLTDPRSAFTDVRLATDGGAVFAGCNGYVCRGRETTTWRTSLERTSMGPYGAVDVAFIGGRLYAGSLGVVYEFDPITGKTVSSQQLSTTAVSPLTQIATDGQDLYAGANGYAYKVRARDIRMNSRLARNWFGGDTWHRWDGPFRNAAPTQALVGTLGRWDLDVFGIASDGRLHSNSLVNGSWGDWTVTFTRETRDVATATSRGFTSWAVLIDDKGSVWTSSRGLHDAKWEQWLPYTSNAPPFAFVQALRGPANVEMFALDLDGTIYHTWADRLVQHGWERNFRPNAPKARSVGGALGPTSHLEVFAVGVDGRLWHNWYGYDDWHDWVRGFEGAPRGTRAVSAMMGPDHLEVFLLDLWGDLWHNWYGRGSDGREGWHAWEHKFRNPPPLLRSVAGVTGPSGHLEVFAAGLDGRLWHNWYGYDDWHTWEDWHKGRADFQQAPLVTAVTALRAPTTTEVFACVNGPET